MRIEQLVVAALMMAVGTVASATTLESDALKVDFDDRTAAFSVTDRRTGRTWRQLVDEKDALREIAVVSRQRDKVVFTARANYLEAPLSVVVAVDGETVRVRLDSDDAATMDYGRTVDTASGAAHPVPKAIWYPYPFALRPKDRTLLPHGSGFAFPADQIAMGEKFPEHMKCYTHDFKMGMWGCYSEKALSSGEIVGADGFLACVETPWNSFGRYTVRSNGLRQFDLGWIQDMRTWGHTRSIRFEFMPNCGPMPIALRYRAEMERRGYRRTFAEKIARQPSMRSKYERIMRSPSVWYWAIGGDKAEVCRILREECGFKDFLYQFARRTDLGTWVTPEEVRECVEKVPDVMLSEYDIYKDTMDRKNLELIDYVRPYWALDAAENGDIVLGYGGEPLRGWGVQKKGTTDPKDRIGCVSICERQAPKYALKGIGARVKEIPQWTGRYLDVTGQFLSECWDPRHRVSLRESVDCRKKILKIVTDVYHLVAASEDGLECFVPELDYLTCGFSGPGGYRGPDNGRWMWRIYDGEVPDSVRRGTDEQTRVPIWEMVFHDCVVSYWDWCDYNNKFTRIWWKRDLFNAVCGTPPLYFFNQETFPRFRKDLGASYRQATSTTLAVAGEQLTAYRFLTSDRTVQRSEWSNGVACTVNFGTKEFVMSDGYRLAPRGMRLEKPQAAADVIVPVDGAAGNVRQLTVKEAGRIGQGFEPVGENEIVADSRKDVAKDAGAVWKVRLDQKVPAQVSVTAEGFVEETDNAGRCCLYVDAFCTDGTPLYGNVSAFDRLISSGWNTRTVTISSAKPLASLSVYALLRGTRTRARFRPPRVRTVDPSAKFFDGVEIRSAQAPEKEMFLVRDAAANGGFEPIVGEAKGLKLAVDVKAENGARFFDVNLADLTGKDRAVTLVYAVPLPAGELTWHQHPRLSMPLKGVTGEVRNVSGSGCGAGIGLSRWPFGAVTVGDRGVAVGLDTSAPAYFRTAVNPELRVLYISFDLGLAPEKRDAHLRFVVFPFEARHAFRGAFEAYRKLFPEAFKVRVRDQGIWMAFAKTSEVSGWQDFGFRIKEGDNETAWDDANGLLSFRYTEPGTWWMKIEGKDGAMATPEACLARIAELKAKGDPSALAWDSSVTRGPGGHPDGKLLDTPWCKGMAWSMNSAPGVPGEKTDFGWKIGDAVLERLYPAAVGSAGLDGEYVDSVDLYVTANLDYARDHFAGMKTPLCFAADTKRPAVFKGLVAYEYVRSLADRLHPKGKLVMSNSTPRNWCWIAPYSDVMGDEVDWNPNGVWQVTDEERLLYKLAMCSGKPHGFLMNTDIHSFTFEMMEKYMKRITAYGMFPSVFSGTNVGKHYFKFPEYYNRDRPLFKKYVPICKRLSEAGWRPVNRLAESPDRSVWTEQFGEKLVTVFNDAKQAKRVKLRVLGGQTEARELVLGGGVSVVNGACEFEIGPEDVRVLEF